MLRATKFFLIAQALVLIALFISFKIYISLEIAFLSSFFILLGSSYSYFSLVKKRAKEYEILEQDEIDKIDDPYDLYDENEIVENTENLDLKEVIKQERAKLKNTNTINNLYKSSPALISIYRVVPYIFLVVGFIGLKNNDNLNIFAYLFGLAIGIFVAFKTSKEVFNS